MNRKIGHKERGLEFDQKEWKGQRNDVIFPRSTLAELRLLLVEDDLAKLTSDLE